MSIRAMNWAWDQALTPTAKLILMALADAADDVGECWPSLRRIASKCLVSERTVQRTLKDFEDRRLLSVSPRFAQDGRQKSNTYLLAIAGLPDKLSPSLQPRQGEGDVGVIPGVSSRCRGEGDIAVSPHEPQQDSSIESPQQPELRWPRGLSQEQVSGIRRLLIGLDHERAQLILSELAEALRVPGTIRTTPVRWVAGLLRIQAQGGFVPSAPTRKQPTPKPPPAAAADGSAGTTEEPPAKSGPSEEVRARLRDVAESLRKRTDRRND